MDRGLEECSIPQRSTSPLALVRFADAVAAFVETDVGQRPAFRALADFAAATRAAEDRAEAGSMSGMDAEYAECADAPTANASGGNTGCDALGHACAAGELLACNDLYWISPVGSTYESLAATCGGRVQFGDRGFGGFCDAMERD